MDVTHSSFIPFTDEQHERMKGLYLKDKKTAREIGLIYGICKDAVRRRLKFLGVEMRPSGRPGAKQVPRVKRDLAALSIEAKALRSTGLKWEAVALTMGVPASTAYRAGVRDDQQTAPRVQNARRYPSGPDAGANAP